MKTTEQIRVGDTAFGVDTPAGLKPGQKVRVKSPDGKTSEELQVGNHGGNRHVPLVEGAKNSYEAGSEVEVV